MNYKNSLTRLIRLIDKKFIADNFLTNKYLTKFYKKRRSKSNLVTSFFRSFDFKSPFHFKKNPVTIFRYTLYILHLESSGKNYFFHSVDFLLISFFLKNYRKTFFLTSLLPYFSQLYNDI